jgi:hypothetical protein
MDVAAIIAAQSHFGWIVKKVDEGANGRVEFATRETVTPPRLILTVVSGSDTTRPVVPDGLGALPATPATFVSPPGDSASRFYRDVVGIRFDDSTSGASVQRILAKYNATIIGGLTRLGEYVTRVPDPGPSYADLSALIVRIRGEPGVRYAAPIDFRIGVEIHSRYPDDGSGAVRHDWLLQPGGTGTWSRLAVNAALAWGCETGAYGSERPKVGVVDWTFDATHPDLVANVDAVYAPRVNAIGDSALVVVLDRQHGTAVAGINSCWWRSVPTIRRRRVST